MCASERGLVVAVAQRGPRVVVTVHLNGGGRRRLTYPRAEWETVVAERGGTDCILGRAVALDGDGLFFLDPEVLFDLGRVLATPGALDALARNACGAWTYLSRHVAGDWGALDPADAAENALSLREGFRLLS